MPSLFGKISIETILPLLQCRGEAECVISLIMIGKEIDATVRGLVSALKHTRLLECLYVSASRTESPYDLTIAPVLYHAVTRSSECVISQRDKLIDLIDELVQLREAIKQYALQNVELALEQERVTTSASTAAKMKQTRDLASMETELTERVDQVLEAATNKIRTQDYEAIIGFNEPSLFLCSAARVVGGIDLNEDNDNGDKDVVVDDVVDVDVNDDDDARENTVVETTNRKRKLKNYPESHSKNSVVPNDRSASKRRSAAPLSDISPSHSQHSNSQSTNSQNSYAKDDQFSTICHPASSGNSAGNSASSPEVDISSTA